MCMYIFPPDAKAEDSLMFLSKNIKQVPFVKTHKGCLRLVGDLQQTQKMKDETAAREHGKSKRSITA